MNKPIKLAVTHKERQSILMKRAGISMQDVAIQSNTKPSQVSQYFSGYVPNEGTVSKKINFAIESLLSERVNPENMGGGE
jgi:transcriptional regulator with XRE-family HTH domain